MSTKSAVVCSYRAIAKLIRGIPESQQGKAVETLRSEFRKNALAQKSEIPALLKVWISIVYTRMFICCNEKP